MNGDDECQLCRLHDYRGDEINKPEGIATVPREDGGTKTIHCCERCADELWDEHDFTPYSQLATDGGRDQSAVELVRDLSGPLVLTNEGVCMVLGRNLVGPMMTSTILGMLLGLFGMGVVALVF